MSEAVRIIKKYPNRRLYDTTTSVYITLVDIKKLVIENVDFKIEDAKTKEDLTRSILLQIILEEESGEGVPMFSSDVLSKIIRFYGNAIQGLMGSYLEQNANAFLEMQQQMQKQSRNLFGTFPFPNFAAANPFVPPTREDPAAEPASPPPAKDEDGSKNGA